MVLATSDLATLLGSVLSIVVLGESWYRYAWFIKALMVLAAVCIDRVPQDVK